MHFKLKDNYYAGVADAYVDFMRYSPASNTYYTVAMLKTDANGQGTTYIRPNDVWFKISAKKDLEILSIFSPQTIPCDPAASFCTLELKLPGEA